MQRRVAYDSKGTNMKKTLLIVLIINLLLVCGCKNGTTNVSEKEVNKNAVYKSETIEITLPDEYNNYELGEMVPCKEGVFFSCYKYEDEENKEDIDWALGYSDMQGNNAEIIDDLTDEDNNDISYMVQTLLGCGNECIAIDYYKNAKSEEGIEEQDYYDSPEYVGVFDKTGKKLAEKELKDYYPCKLIIDDSIILSDYSNIISWDYLKDKEIKCDAASYTDLLKGGSGALIAYGPDKEGNNEYIYINAKTLEEEKRVKGTVSINNNDDIVAAGNTSEEFFIFSGKNVLGYTPGDEQVHLICDGEYSGLYFGGSIRDTYVEENGDFYVLAEQYSNSSEPEFKLIKGVKIPPEEVKDRKEIRIGCLGISYSDVDEIIAEFNSTSEEYYYTLTEYLEEENAEEYLSPIGEFEKAIMAENIPDIVMCGTNGIGQSFNLNNYISKGIFMPLDDLIEADKEIDSQDIFPCLREACSLDGKMYTIIPCFNIKTMIVKSKNYQGEAGWTYLEFSEFLKSHKNSRPFYNTTRYELCENFLAMEDNPFYSVATGKCNFQSEEFIQFLELLKSYGEDFEFDRNEYEYDREVFDSYSKDESLAVMCEMHSAEDFVVSENGFFGEDLKVVGYPNNKGLLGYINPQIYVMGISHKTKYPEAAWEFVRSFLQEDYQKDLNTYIPASMKAYEYQSEKRLRKEKVQGWFMYDYVDLRPLTRDDIDRFKAVIIGSVGNSYYDEVITQIINEEAQAYYAGEKTAEDVAKIIQSRVSIHLKEKTK